MRSAPQLLAVLASLWVKAGYGRSLISTFSDSNCQDSITTLDGPNGYPNGTCTDIRSSGPYGSFQIVGLDAGCTVTIYMNDTTADICSGFATANTHIADCYNSTWVYYSIDFCDKPVAGLSTSTSPASLTSSIVSPSPTRFFTFTSPREPLRSHFSTVTPLPQTPLPEPSLPQETASTASNHTGAIVGGVLGGIASIAAVIALTVYMTRRTILGTKRLASVSDAGRAEPIELHAEFAKEMPVSTEIFEKPALEPMTRLVELPAEKYKEDDKPPTDPSEIKGQTDATPPAKRFY